MSDNLTVFGTNYTNVTGIKAKGTGNGILTYICPAGTKSITANGTSIDVTEYASVDVDVDIPTEPLIVTPTTSQQTFDDLITAASLESGGFNTVQTSNKVVDSSNQLSSSPMDGVSYTISGYLVNSAAGINIRLSGTADFSWTYSGNNRYFIIPTSAYEVTGSGASRIYSIQLYHYRYATVSAPVFEIVFTTTSVSTGFSISEPILFQVNTGIGYLPVTVNPIPSQYVVPSGTLSITENGTTDVTNYASVNVAVPSISPTLITKSITENGTYNASSDNADGYSSVTVNVSGGSGGGGNMSDPIRFFDYDGTLVASYSAVPASLPSVPTHDKLTNGTWNYTLAQVATQFNAMGTCDVGANYDTVSGATEIDIVLQEGRLHPYLSLAVNGTVTIDWGDNSTDTKTGASLTSNVADIHHEYAAAGSYTIKITKTSGTGYSLFCSAKYLLLNKNGTTSNVNRVYANCVQAVRVGEDCVIGLDAFYYCCSLASISIPSGVTNIGNSAFYCCYSLEFVSIPSGVKSIAASTFYTCHSLASVSLPSGVTSIDSQAFFACERLASVSLPSGVTSIGGSVLNACQSLASVSLPSGITSIGTSAIGNCQSLASVSLPSGVTSIGQSALSACYSLTSISIPSGVTSIAATAFNNCYGMAEYHFEPTTPPTLANINAFANIQSDCVIYVPAESLTAYQEAENWSTYASYMVGE